MKNATVSMPFNDFMTIKNRADQLDRKRKNEDKKDEFLENLVTCIEDLIDTEGSHHKQYYLAKAINLICDYYELDVTKEYGEVDPGVAP